MKLVHKTLITTIIATLLLGIFWSSYMKNLLSVFTAVTIITAPVINAEPDVFMSFDFQNGELERGFDDWYYSDKGEDPCDVYAGETRSKLCGPNNSKVYLYYNSYNNDHMGWLRYGYIDSSQDISVNGSALKLQTTGGAYRVSDERVEFRGIETRSKSDLPPNLMSNDLLEEDEVPNYLGNMSIYIKGNDSYSRFPSLQGKNRFSVWVLLPTDHFELDKFSSAHQSSTSNRVSWYPFIGRSTGGHYYHRSANVPMGGWTKIQFDAHPTHHNGGSNNQYSAFSTGGYEYPGDSVSYFNNITTMALVVKGAKAQSKYSEFYLDEFTTDYVEYQNEETINNVGIGYSPETQQFDISFEDKYRCLQCAGLYEVKYSFSPITNANYDDAHTPEYTVNFSRSKSNTEGLIHKPNKGYNLLWAAIDIKEEHKAQLTPYKDIYFAVKDLSTRENITPQAIDSELVDVPGLGEIKRVDLIKSIDYKIIPVYLPLEVSTKRLDELVTGQHFEQQLEAFGGEKPYVFNAISVPQGLTLSSSGKLHGTPLFAGPQSLQFQVTGALGEVTTRTINVEVLEPESFNVDNCSVVADFKNSQEESVIYDDRFDSIFKDKYTGFTEFGTTIQVGSNKNYDHQGISGSGFTLYPNDQVRMVWKNVSNETISFSPRVSFTDDNRVSANSEAGWNTASTIEVKPGESAISEFTLEEAVTSTFINVNVNHANNNELILDKIQLVEAANSSGSICTRYFTETEQVNLLVVDFKDSLSSSVTPMVEFSNIIKDVYTGIIGEGSATVVGSNGGYNYQGVTGVGRDLVAGDKIQLTWTSVHNEDVTFSPRLSLDDVDRYSRTEKVWYELEPVNVLVNNNATSVFTITEENAGLITSINVNNNLDMQGAVLLDKIELITANPMFGFLPNEDLNLVLGDVVNTVIKTNNTELLNFVTTYSTLPSGVMLDADGNLTGEAVEVGEYPVTFVAESILGDITEQNILIKVSEPEGVLTEQCRTLVNFNDGELGWATLADDILEIGSDRYTGFHLNGMTTTIGTNKNYNYQWVKGDINVNHGETVLRTVWFNDSQDTITFTPRVSFVKDGRVSNMDDNDTWLPMSEITIEPGKHAISSMNLSNFANEYLTLINVNVNHESKKTLILNRIELFDSTLDSDKAC